MGWKGTLRTVGAASRRYERYQRQLEKMKDVESATHEVEVYESYIDLLQSMHKECSEALNWEEIRHSKPPEKPTMMHVNEMAAKSALDNYKPGLTDKILKKSKDFRQKLIDELDAAKETDECEYQEALARYAQDYAEWENIRKISGEVLSGDTNAYLVAMKIANPFEELEEIGLHIEFKLCENSIITAILHVNGEQIIPSEGKTLLKSGKLSVKSLPKGRFYEIYQDYVCSGVLRVAREFCALLPADMLIVTAMTRMLNTKTGHIEEQPILSAVIPRKTMDMLNFETIDPSDSMGNFVHRMEFKKTKGFAAVEPITENI